jgi:hypothetical protein
VPGMAREYAQFQIDLRPVHWQTHVSTHFNDPSQLDSWTVLIYNLKSTSTLPLPPPHRSPNQQHARAPHKSPLRWSSRQDCESSGV